jgi:ketosteroid isomerase-like protein
VKNTNERLLRRAYEAFNARDIDGALATMHADVDWPMKPARSDASSPSAPC